MKSPLRLLARIVIIQRFQSMTTFDELVGSRREWIETVLKPWCRIAPRKELLKAEQEWPNLAGRVDPERTLWLWAWGRFPALVADGLHGIDETHQVVVARQGGGSLAGYPDARESRQGRLVLHGDASPIDLDEIVSVERTAESA
ncbi:MAG: hypothetical protein DWQ45_25400 [Planctomycetota bacterium]|nr:MAG: hypothetical protein DWQ29_07345 [Planctomycetota bacterium]REK22252.1 MAG: hypothetical protein DWQ41_19480 [Planctomycetota bacterium]REK27434.1 MAG: hypothetical protein DWQ45_25400 [Planctomycetota bacterium]